MASPEYKIDVYVGNTEEDLHLALINTQGNAIENDIFSGNLIIRIKGYQGLQPDGSVVQGIFVCFLI